MKFFKNLFVLRHHQKVDDSVLDKLFLVQRNTLISLILLETILLYILIPLIGNTIAAWYGIILTITLWRLYDSHDYKNNPHRHSPLIWHKKLVIKIWLTALMLSALALFAVPQLDPYYQLFIFIVLIGVSAGAVKNLSDDYRTAIGYLLILLVPISTEMLLLERPDTYILAFLLILYFFSQASIVLRSYEQSNELEQKKKEISEVKEELFEKDEMLHLFFDQAPIGIFSYDVDLNITDCNQSFLTHFNIEKEKIIGIDLNELSNEKSIKAMKDSLTKGIQTYVGSYNFLNGIEFWVEGKYSPVYNKEGTIIGGMGLIEDKTKEHYAVNELKYLASHDPLTSLSNRRGFREFMTHMIHERKHLNHFSILFYLDLNQFKNINDSLGHTFGDKLLIAISKRLKLLMDTGNNLTRLGGDEFTIVVPFVDKEREKAKEKADECVIKIQKSFDESFIIEGVRLHMKTSIGIVIIEPNFFDIEEIVRHADISMYEAKKHDHEHISYYNTQLDMERKKTFDLQHDLGSARQENQLELFFQPIVNIKDDSLRAAEALLRWKHPEKGLILPMDFIPIAIESDTIADIGWWALEQVCSYISQWKKRGEWKLKYVSINIDAKQLMKSDFADNFLATLEQYEVKTSDIKIEVTETTLIDNFETTHEIIKKLQDKGVKCAIDDFGTGYSSLSYLKKLSFSVLKIDREFVRDILHKEDHITLLRTIIEIGKQFNYNIVVEGIEEEAQREVIKEIDDTLSYQGFLVSPPISEEEFRMKFLKS